MLLKYVGKKKSILFFIYTAFPETKYLKPAMYSFPEKYAWT